MGLRRAPSVHPQEVLGRDSSPCRLRLWTAHRSVRRPVRCSFAHCSALPPRFSLPVLVPSVRARGSVRPVGGLRLLLWYKWWGYAPCRRAFNGLPGASTPVCPRTPAVRDGPASATSCPAAWARCACSRATRCSRGSPRPWPRWSSRSWVARTPGSSSPRSLVAFSFSSDQRGRERRAGQPAFSRFPQLVLPEVAVVDGAQSSRPLNTRGCSSASLSQLIPSSFHQSYPTSFSSQSRFSMASCRKA